MPAKRAPTQVQMLADDRRAEVAAVWRSLEAGAADCPFACTWAWTETWLEHFGDLVPHRFAIGSRGDEPRGAALVTETVHRFPEWLYPRTLRLGTAGEPLVDGVWVERNGLLAADGELGGFAAGLLAALNTGRGWERLQIDGFMPAHAEALREADPRLVIETKETPIADLSAKSDVVDALSSSRRRRIRQTLSKFGALELEWAPDAERAVAILEELAVLHQQRHQAAGRPGAFASPRFTAFHQALIRRLGSGAAVVRVHRGTETVGCLYGLIEDGRLLFYQSGLRRYEDNKLRAGVAAHVLFMRACADRGLRTYDFLAPPDRYKRELSTGADELCWARLDRTPRARLMTAARDVYRRARDVYRSTQERRRAGRAAATRKAPSPKSS